MKMIPSSWEELPADLLCLVLRRLPSLDDRVHLRSTCRPWRAGTAGYRLPPPLPLLALRDGGLVNLDGATVRCQPILLEGVASFLTVNNLAFLVHDDGTCSLTNPLSGLTLPLPELAHAMRRAIEELRSYTQSYIFKNHVKAILSSPLDDSASDPLIAVLFMEGKKIAISSCKRHDAAVTVGLPPDPDGIRGPPKVDDIAFLHGRLYALTLNEGLHFVELDAAGTHLTVPKLPSSQRFRQCITEDPTQQRIYYFGTRADPGYLVLRYLAECGGMLLMIRRWMSFPLDSPLGERDRTFKFEVFQADLATAPGRWTMVDSLDGQAIFLGSECSKSVLASQCPGGIQEDCIYFMHRVFDNPSHEYLGPCVDPLTDSGVYNMRDGVIMPLVTESAMAGLRGKQQFMTWFFPCDA